MSAVLQIRQMERADLRDALSLVRSSFEDRLWPFMTYTQTGASDYLAVTLDYPTAVPHLALRVAVAPDGEIVGFADFRLLGGGAAHLSYICVAPAARGQGLAASMIHDFVKAHEILQLQLDVFSDNRPALSLYSRLGFVVSRTSAWVSRPLPPMGLPVTVPKLAAGLAALDRYGFCELHVGSVDDGQKIGLIGAGVVRAFERHQFEDDGLLAGVRAVFPERTTAFCIVGGEEVPTLGSDTETIIVSHRMTAATASVNPPSEGN